MLSEKYATPSHRHMVYVQERARYEPADEVLLKLENLGLISV